MSPAERILNSIPKQIPPIPLTGTYRFAMLVTAALMIVLPLLYLGVVGGVAGGIWYYFDTMNFTPSGSGRASLGSLIFYLFPPALGVVLVIALLKPIFAAPIPRVRPLRLDRRRERLLYAYVERLCQALNAPKPTAIELNIDANASASFEDKEKGGGLILTLGAPLVAGLSLPQLAGVMAHEIGHFNQRTALRSIRVVRRVSHFFARLAHERDHFDAWLEHHSNDEETPFIARLFLYLARGLIWLTRRLFIGLVWLSQALSCFQLRQMEYDADRYEARLVGADVFTDTVEELQLLNIAQHQAMGNLEELWSDGRLPDSLPHLVVRNRRAFESDLIGAVKEAILTSKVGFFSTHPADKDRLANIQKEKIQPAFRNPENPAHPGEPIPATALFSNFSQVAGLATRAHYCTVMGEALRPEVLIPVEETAQRLEQSSSEREAFRRYFRGDLTSLWPLAVGRITPGGTLEGLAQVRQNAFSSVDRLNHGIESYSKAWGALLRTAQAEGLLAVGLQVDAKAMELPGNTLPKVIEFQGQAQRRMADLEKKLRPLEEARGTRLGYALGLLTNTDIATRVDADGAIRAEVGPLLEIQVLMGSLFKGCREVMRDHAVLCALAAQWQENQENQALRSRLRQSMQRLVKRLGQLANALGDIEYPFEHRYEEITLAQYIVDFPDQEDGLGGVIQGTSNTLDQFYEVYFRVAGRLAFIGERIEETLGYEPLPLPESSD